MFHPNIAVVDYEATCAAGPGLEALRAAIGSQQTGLRRNDLDGCDLNTWIGRVDAIDRYQWQGTDTPWQSRNNALIDIALQQGSLLASLNQLKQQCEPSRFGVIMGSSTSSIDRSEEAYRQLDENGQLQAQFLQEDVLNPHSPGLFVAHRLGLRGPHMTINTACSSSAKVFATAARWLRAGIVDAVLVGGADTLCLSVLYGFNALQLVSAQPCRPFDAERDGINLGEAAGFALLVRAEDAPASNDLYLRGYGESSDAHHMSHPHPTGAGARLAIELALGQAELSPADIDYINLHGTASRANDDIEGNLVGSMFGNTLASSTKGWTGHTLGAAGILEAVIALDSMRQSLAPGTLNLSRIDPAIRISVNSKNSSAELKHVMSNSFGFGGNNACLIFARKNKEIAP